MPFNWIEIFGTTASIVVAISLMMKNIKRLRIINAIGALGFTIYGALIGALPVWILNGFIVIIDIYYLAKMRLTRDRFDILEGDPFQASFVTLFMDNYKADIAHYQPDFALEPGKGWLAELVLRDLNPVALVVYRKLDEATIEIGLDYAAPSYRDFKSAEFYFGKAEERIASGREISFVQRSSVVEHQRYLERLGFSRGPAGEGGLVEFRKTIPGKK